MNNNNNGIGLNQATEGECEDFIQFSELFDIFKKNKEMGKVENYGVTSAGFGFIRHIDYALEKVRIFNISEQQKKFFLLGKPNYNMEIKLPYSHIFLDCKFTKEELAQYGIKIDANEMHGVIVSRGYIYKQNEKLLSLMDNNKEYDPAQEGEMGAYRPYRAGECLRFAVCLVNGTVMPEIEIVFDVFDKSMKLYEGVEKYMLPEDTPLHLKERELWHNFFLNFLRFVNFPKIELKEHIRSEKSIARRKLKRLPPIPASVRISVLDGNLVQYIDEFNTNVKRGWHYAYQFDVKGHYRHLRSPRYKMQGDIWIEPYKKGIGKFVPTIYEVKQKPNGKANGTETEGSKD
jgi:hypothetical protein